MNLIRSAWHLRDLCHRVPDAPLLFASRVFVAAIFWQSGRTKVDGWALNDSTAYLFAEEYRLPLIDPLLAAQLAAIAEHVFPLLLVLGIGSRLAAAALLSITLVIQCFVYPDAWATHGTWAALLAWVVFRGPGQWSLDAWFWAPRGKAEAVR